MAENEGPPTGTNPPEQKVTKCLVGSVFFATIGTSFLFGYNIGVLNNLELPIREHIMDDWDMRNQTKESVSFVFSTVQAIWTGLGMAGAFSTSLVLKLGRKKAILANCLVMLIGIAFESVTLLAKQPTLLILGRAVVGFACGLNVGLVNVFLPEISFKSVRGAVSACHQLQTTFGILFAQIMTLTPLFGHTRRWPYAFAVSCIGSVLTMICLPFFPDSPRYLLLSKKDKDGALKALIRLRGTTEVDDEILEMETEEEEMRKVDTFTIKQLFTSKTFRRSLIIVIVLQVAQQFSGINFIFFYSGEMFDAAGLGQNKQYAVLSTGIINFIATIVSLYLLEKIGRRPLLIYPLVMMGVASGVLVITLQYQSVAILNIVLTCIYIVGFAVGLGPIPPFVASEVFTQEPRPAAMTVGTFVNFTCTLVVALITPILRDTIQSYVFIIFIVFIVASVAFVIVVVPETKNRTFEDIFQQLANIDVKEPTPEKGAEMNQFRDSVKLENVPEESPSEAQPVANTIESSVKPPAETYDEVLQLPGQADVPQDNANSETDI